ncbi:hypothetical protein NUW54_g5963 [Trametes sanguinea]|uniref:Uncharacterized protein n=1 Tax=Trametes sanguinea TaxID=158606 RepID=A0ACC1PTN9_9APHY|nr:hypothetical protein NUW54_g5963 [Trametes sanguinea]
MIQDTALTYKLEDAKRELEIAQRQGQYEKASRLRFATIPELERQLPSERAGERGESEDAEGPLSMLHDRVTSADIARVVAKATGIPVQSLLKGEREKLVHMEEVLKKRVVGQDHVVQQAPPKKSGPGIGTALLAGGAGLVGGALLMDAFEDHEEHEREEAYDAGYDQGYDQGFDQGDGDW